MKETPINYNSEMIMAFLEGRKNQTRRIVRPQPSFGEFLIGLFVDCPYGKVGDRIWARESLTLWPGTLEYSADGTALDLQDQKKYEWFKNYQNANCPADEMPKWASRFMHEIKDIRIEKLCDMSEADAINEGFAEDIFNCTTAVNSFAYFWDSIYGCYEWEKDPFVWVIELENINV